ncbi:MAG TPA: TonB-dependent receptor [Terriglobia bacterium]|nr:TonB-dependent receptor [Terriglobia bacterium]
MKPIRFANVAMSVLEGFLFFFLATSTVWAQAVSTAQISGSVKDQSGAVLPGVEISVTQLETGLKRSVVTDETGSYVLINLPIGPYRLEAVLPGFRTYVQSGIVLQVNSNPVINAVLQVGQVSETLEVQAAAAMVETQTTGVGTVMDNKRVLELPLNGRNATELIFLSGMATVATGQSAGLSSPRNYPAIVVSVAGGVGDSVLFLLDGGYHLDTQAGLNLPLPFPDALQEFKVETSALPAQYGDHAAATVNAVTKAGTNEFHGDVFEFIRNGVFNARNFFAPKRDTLKRNQVGGVVGGPIKKDKLFFFAGYQGTFERSDPPSSIAYVPTAAMLAGDFTAVASPPCNGGRQVTLAQSQGFLNNTISPNRFDPVALKIASLFPGTEDPCGKTTYALKSNQDEHLLVTRIDYQKSQKNSIFGRFELADLKTPSTYDGKNPITINLAESKTRVYSLVLGNTYLVGPDIVSSFRLGVNRSWNERLADHFYSFADLGMQGFSVLGSDNDSKTIRLGVQGNGFTIGAGNNIQVGNWSGPNTNLVEDVNLVKGAHQIGFGVNYLHQIHNLTNHLNTVGTVAINGQISGMPLADFLLGNASSWNQGGPQLTYNRQHHFGLYVQDSWRTIARLRINYGVRWEPYLAPYSKYNTWTHFDPDLFVRDVHSIIYPNAPAGLIFPGDTQYTIGNHPEGNSWKQAVPRLGLVWDPKGDALMTIRAGYGIFTSRPHLGTSYVAFQQNNPFLPTVNLPNVKLSNPWATYPGGNPFPLVINKDSKFPLFGTYRTDPFDYQPTYMNQWNVSIQKQFGMDWLVSANYVGNSTIHLVTSTQLNAPQYLGLGPCTIAGVSYPTCSTTGNQNQRRPLFQQNPNQGQYLGSIQALDDGGTGNYHGLLLSVQKRLSHGTSVMANHTWSHCISDNWNHLLDGLNLPGERAANRSNCQTGDQRHVFNVSAVLQTPTFSSRILQLVANGWQLSPIIKIRSAQFFTVTTGVDSALTAQPNQVPNLVPGVSPYAADKSVDQWLNPAAFAAPAPGTYGNLGRFNLKGPAVFQLDVALARTFPIREGKTLQLRVEAFNLPNHPNFSTPVATLNSGAFGKIQSDISGTSGLTAGNPRILQFAMKVGF